MRLVPADTAMSPSLLAILLERIEGVRLCETILFRARCSRITS